MGRRVRLGRKRPNLAKEETNKGYTAVAANRLLNRSSPFWEHESYDHFVRDEAELNRIRRYILQNPVKAGLVESAEAWPWSYAAWLIDAD